MKLEQLKAEIQKYQHLEDTNILDVALASIIATRLSVGDPIWLVIIGPSSGGKSQILRPLSLTDKKFLHRVDDLTENTFLSASNIKGGEVSLLKKIGPRGIIVISDLTVLFSKSAEIRATILSQFRMIYDGEMIKYAGNQAKPIEWRGSLGIIAGSTPSLYSQFEEVADMGERFIYYRMKEYDEKKASKIALSRTVYGKQLDEILSNLYQEYIKEVVKNFDQKEIVISEQFKERILDISILAEKIRTTSHTDFRTRELDRIPVRAMPMRVALQLISITKGLTIMRNHEGQELSDNDYNIIQWCGYSLANEEKRACLKILASIDFVDTLTTQQIADQVGLNTHVISVILQNMAAVGVLKRSGANNSHTWKIKESADYALIRLIERLETVAVYEAREATSDEIDEDEQNRKFLDF